MRVAIISKSDRNAGGASKVAEDLTFWLNAKGYPTDHFIAFAVNEREIPFQRKLYGIGAKAKLCKQIHKFTNRLGFRELLPAEYWFNLSQVIDNYDIIHFHDLYTAISPITLALVARRRPTFFTVHDCSAFTGGCLYPMDCEKFTSYCHQCPQLGQKTWKERIRDRTREIQSIKRYITKQFDIRYIFPSNWIALQASLSLEFKIPSVVIPNGIDLAPFEFKDKSQVKNSLGIAENRQVIVISALSLNDERKGASYAVTAIQSVIDLNPIVITVGERNESLLQKLQGLEVIEMGFIADSLLMAKIYSAADIMLFCSLADNLPLTVLEAMAAASTVVGFSIGGVPDMIKSGLNGVLVEPRNQEALNQALRQTMLSGNLRKMGQQARFDVENNFSKDLFLENHLQIYQNALDNRKML
jgi:glycosyltransferase involved in cell wall biosynthesis